jgi:CubicO group peptidase (beta-lactamase class C family)
MHGLDLAGLMALSNIAGLSVAVVRHGATEVLEAYGYADRSAEKPARTTTVFEAASLGKPVFAYLTLKLVDAGLLKLDEPLGGLAPALRQAGDLAASITARHVLSHTTGLPNWRSAKRPFRCHFTPGERFSYSGEGYVILQSAVERLTGGTLDELARRLVFQPLGMSRSSYNGRDLPPDEIAMPHDEVGRSLPKAWLAANAAGSLHTTADDYARFLRAVLTGEGLSQRLARAWLRPNHRAPFPFFAALDPVGHPKLHPSVAWGLGWGVEGDTETFFHWGSNPGFKSFAAGSVRDGCALVLLSTGATELALGPAVTARVLPGPRPCLDWFGLQDWRPAP